MTFKFHHRSLKNRHKAVSMTISNSVMYRASQITPHDVSYIFVINCLIHDVSKMSQNVPRPPKPNPNPFSITKINVINNIIFVTNSIAMSCIDDVVDDVAGDLAMMWIAMMTCQLMWSMTWLLTWQLRGKWC